MVTVFAALLRMGVGFSCALIIQGVVMVLAAAGVFSVWHGRFSLSHRAAALVLGTRLFTPYAFAYDLALLALPLAWLGWKGYETGWRPGEPALLCLGWLLPFLAPILAIIRCQLTPVVLAVFLILVVTGPRIAAGVARA
jgi:hypothetical protein